MPQTCTKCSRSNPSEASYCHFDGSPLAGHGVNGGPIRVGSQMFHSPFVFASGQVCRNFDQLALAFHADWSATLDMLQQGYLETFLSGLGRLDLALAAREAAKFPDRDRGLDQFLEKLPSDSLQAPRLHVAPLEINLGVLLMGEDRSFDLHLENQGMRLLYGTATCEDTVWLSLGEGAGAQQ